MGRDTVSPGLVLLAVEVEGSTILRNVGNHSSDDMASHSWPCESPYCVCRVNSARVPEVHGGSMSACCCLNSNVGMSTADCRWKRTSLNVSNRSVCRYVAVKFVACWLIVLLCWNDV